MAGSKIEPRDVPITREYIHSLYLQHNGDPDLIRADMELDFPAMVDRIIYVDGTEVSVFDHILSDLASYA